MSNGTGKGIQFRHLFFKLFLQVTDGEVRGDSDQNFVSLKFFKVMMTIFWKR